VGKGKEDFSRGRKPCRDIGHLFSTLQTKERGGGKLRLVSDLEKTPSWGGKSFNILPLKSPNRCERGKKEEGER